MEEATIGGGEDERASKEESQKSRQKEIKGKMRKQFFYFAFFCQKDFFDIDFYGIFCAIL